MKVDNMAIFIVAGKIVILEWQTIYELFIMADIKASFMLIDSMPFLRTQRPWLF